MYFAELKSDIQPVGFVPQPRKAQTLGWPSSPALASEPAASLKILFSSCPLTIFSQALPSDRYEDRALKILSPRRFRKDLRFSASSSWDSSLEIFPSIISCSKLLMVSFKKIQSFSLKLLQSIAYSLHSNLFIYDIIAVFLLQWISWVNLHDKYKILKHWLSSMNHSTKLS